MTTMFAFCCCCGCAAVGFCCVQEMDKSRRKPSGELSQSSAGETDSSSEEDACPKDARDVQLQNKMQYGQSQIQPANAQPLVNHANAGGTGQVVMFG